MNWLRLIERRTNGLRPAARQERNPTKEMEMKFLLWKELRELIAGVSPAGPGRFANHKTAKQFHKSNKLNDFEFNL